MEEVIDPNEISIIDGVFLVKLARKAIEAYLRSGEVIKPPPNTPEKLFRLGMSFVTILEYPSNELRGCIGYTQAFEPLVKNVINAAIAAATQDPRFPPMSIEELGRVIIEVSVLSEPKEVNRKGIELVKEVAIGRDGLIVDYGMYKGLLLPEVPIDYCWDEETFLSETCLKAGLEPDCWLSNKVRIFRYYTKTFRELEPEGEIIERNLKEEYRRKCRT